MADNRQLVSNMTRRDELLANELRELLSRATAGPWSAKVIPVSISVSRIGYAHQIVIGDGGYSVGHSARVRATQQEAIGDGCVREWGTEEFPPPPEPNADAALIVWLRNHADEIVEALENRSLASQEPSE